MSQLSIHSKHPWLEHWSILLQFLEKNLAYGINSTDTFLALCNLLVLILLKSGWFLGSFPVTGILHPPAAMNGSIHPFIHATFTVCTHCVHVALRGPACLSLVKYRGGAGSCNRPKQVSPRVRLPCAEVAAPPPFRNANIDPVFCPGGAAKDSDLQDLDLKGTYPGPDPDRASPHKN